MQTKYIRMFWLSQILQNALIAHQLKDYFSIDVIQYIYTSRELFVFTNVLLNLTSFLQPFLRHVLVCSVDMCGRWVFKRELDFRTDNLQEGIHQSSSKKLTKTLQRVYLHRITTSVALFVIYSQKKSFLPKTKCPNQILKFI